MQTQTGQSVAGGSAVDANESELLSQYEDAMDWQPDWRSAPTGLTKLIESNLLIRYTAESAYPEWYVLWRASHLSQTVNGVSADGIKRAFAPLIEWLSFASIVLWAVFVSIVHPPILVAAGIFLVCAAPTAACVWHCGRTTRKVSTEHRKRVDWLRALYYEEDVVSMRNNPRRPGARVRRMVLDRTGSHEFLNSLFVNEICRRSVRAKMILNELRTDVDESAKSIYRRHAQESLSGKSI